MLTLILYVLGFAMTARITSRTAITAEGVTKAALVGWERYAAGALWPFFAVIVVYDAIKSRVKAHDGKA